MDKATKVVIGLFCVALPLFLVLFSYMIVINVVSLSLEQDRWMNYFEEKSKMEGNYTLLEVSHMEDVKKVIQKVRRVFWGMMGVILLLAGYLYRRNELGRGLRYGGITTIAGVIFILLWAVVDFNSLFTLFHLLFFPQGNWQFGIDSVLIQTFPIDFFIGMSLKIFGLTLLLAGMVTGAGYWLEKKKNRM